MTDFEPMYVPVIPAGAVTMIASARSAASCDEAVAIDGGQRDTHLRGRIYGAVNEDCAQLKRLTLDGVSGGNLLSGGCGRLSRHGSNITGQVPRGDGCGGTHVGSGPNVERCA